MTSPPPCPPPVSMFSSRTSSDEIQSVAEAMPRSSLSQDPSSSSSTATTLHPYPKTPHSHTEERSTSPQLSTSPHCVSVGPDSSMDQGDMPTAAMHLPSSGSSSTLAVTSHQGGTSGLSATEAKLRVLQLKCEARAVGAESPRRSTAGLFKAACSTDLLFLIDTTGSMAGHITAAKEQVKSIVNDIKLAFLNEAEVRIAVVGYKDHLDTPNTQCLDFTPSVDLVHSFLNELTATGGNDTPEDVLGGIREALNLTWKQQTRCIIHIADAPPHGRTLHDMSGFADNYLSPGGEPHGLTHEPLLKQMVGLGINYALLRINSSTDRMAFVFLQIYAAALADCKLHKFNKYYSQACNLSAGSRSSFRRRGSSSCRAKAGLLFEEAELGTTFSSLRHLVVKSVTTSASRTAVRVSTSAARSPKAGSDKKLDTNLAAVEEDEDDAHDAQLETVPPQWDTLGWLNETLVVEGFSPDIVVHGASTLNDMMAHDDNIKMSITDLTIHRRSRPFAQGAMRVASYARTAASTNCFVVKSFKRGGKRLAHLAEDMRCQALCKAFALEFNALSGEEYSIDFIVTTCLKGKSKMASDDECMSLEPFIEGTYVKYNNNCGYVNEDNPDDRFNQAAQAFSHFTFERSRGAFLVSDLQGVGHVLTDPVIHTLDPERFKLADTNLGKEGFKFFFATHVCNSICLKLGLMSNAAMIMSGSHEFRESWPSMDNTVCCSNKLCGRIVRLAKAKKSDKFPGCHWCDACWPQLRSSMAKLICAAPGPRHKFDVSRFFYESQGRFTPCRCPRHGEEDELASRTAVVNAGFWARLRVATTKKVFCGMIQ